MWTGVRRGSLSLVVLVAAILSGGRGFAADFKWIVGPDTVTPQFTFLDTEPAIFNDGTNLWVIYSDGKPRWHVLKGTTMDDLVEQYESVLDASFDKPHGDDHYWNGGGWRDPESGKWHLIVHVEFNYGPNWPNGGWFRNLGLATSSDNGVSWHYEGDIITSDNPVSKAEYSGSYYDFGVGDPKFFADTANGYFYVWYLNSWKRKGTNVDLFDSMRVARSPMNSKMMPGAWKKWYEESWSQPGIGGHDSDVFPGVVDTAVFYSTYLGRYVAIGTNFKNKADVIATATDLGSQDWTTPEQFIHPNRLLWYSWPMDASTGVKGIVGQVFRLYSSCNGCSGLKGKYMDVTFTEGAAPPITFEMEYPPESVPDFNPVWQWDLPQNLLVRIALAESRGADSALQLEIMAPVGVGLLLESSVDLSLWSESDVVIGNGVRTPVRVDLTSDGSIQGRYWRVRQR